MIKFAKYSFYEQDEHVPIPRSFDLIAESDQKMIYAKSAYGRFVLACYEFLLASQY